MTTIVLYRFRGTYRGGSEFEYTLPEPGTAHDGLLFVRQELEGRDDDAARAAALRYGFADLEIQRATFVDPAALATPEGAEFVPYVRWATAQGAALMWY